MANTPVPSAIGIIMDGNRRWAKHKDLPTLQGHRKGLEKLKDIARHAREKGVETLYFYAFSTENWNRHAEEVSYLMDLFAYALAHELTELREEGVRVRFLGDLSRLPSPLAAAAKKFENETAHGKNGTVALCLSYGGRPEILAAVNALLAKGEKSVSEEDFKKALWGGDLPDPDLIIRTGGEERLSNFLTWQSAYSELVFTDTYWPAFTCEEFDKIIAEYASRERRHGK